MFNVKRGPPMKYLTHRDHVVSQIIDNEKVKIIIHKQPKGDAYLTITLPKKLEDEEIRELVDAFIVFEGKANGT